MLERASEILYAVSQAALDEGRQVFAGQVIAAWKAVGELRKVEGGQ
jgi:hypothetical protein